MEKEKTKKNVKKEMSKQDKTLIATFIGLIILVAVLGIVALNLDNIHKDDNQDLVIPVLEENSESELSVEVADLEEGATMKERNAQIISKKFNSIKYNILLNILFITKTLFL